MSGGWMLNLLVAVAMLTFRVPVTGQIVNDSMQIKKGSYLHFGHAAIEDNSIYLEEAFNQAAGIIQFISGTVISNKTIETAFEIEIPLAGEKHQLSVGSSYSTSFQNVTTVPNALGAIQISYRPLLSGKHRWIMVIPRLTITLPRKNTPEEFSYHRPMRSWRLPLLNDSVKTLPRMLIWASLTDMGVSPMGFSVSWLQGVWFGLRGRNSTLCLSHSIQAQRTKEVNSQVRQLSIHWFGFHFN